MAFYPCSVRIFMASPRKSVRTAKVLLRTTRIPLRDLRAEQQNLPPTPLMFSQKKIHRTTMKILSRRPLLCTLFISLLSLTDVYCFTIHQRNLWTKHHNSIYRTWSSHIAAKPKRSATPANLRRKITAKRPPLGHIVPKQVRKQGTGGSANPRLRPQGKAREAGLNNPSMLRIASGTAKGRRLDSPNVYLRPMMGKVREAVFSTLTSFGLYEVDNTRHLDIFAGSGSVGLESLSRGAVHCTFVDLSEDCCAAVKRNLAWCGFEGQGHVVCGDALSVLRQPFQAGIPETQTYQIVTLCPPYEEVVYGDLLEAVVNSPAVTDDTIVLVEYPVELGCLPHVVRRENGGAMIGVRNRRYGRTVIAMYIVNPTGKLEVADSRPEEFVEV